MLETVNDDDVIQKIGADDEREKRNERSLTYIMIIKSITLKTIIGQTLFKIVLKSYIYNR